MGCGGCARRRAMIYQAMQAGSLEAAAGAARAVAQSAGDDLVDWVRRRKIEARARPTRMAVDGDGASGQGNYPDRP